MRRSLVVSGPWGHTYDVTGPTVARHIALAAALAFVSQYEGVDDDVTAEAFATSIQLLGARAVVQAGVDALRASGSTKGDGSINGMWLTHVETLSAAETEMTYGLALQHLRYLLLLPGGRDVGRMPDGRR